MHTYTLVYVHYLFYNHIHVHTHPRHSCLSLPLYFISFLFLLDLFLGFLIDLIFPLFLVCIFLHTHMHTPVDICIYTFSFSISFDLSKIIFNWLFLLLSSAYSPLLRIFSSTICFFPPLIVVIQFLLSA